MNKIYRLKFKRHTRELVVVSEVTKGVSKENSGSLSTSDRKGFFGAIVNGLKRIFERAFVWTGAFFGASLAISAINNDAHATGDNPLNGDPTIVQGHVNFDIKGNLTTIHTTDKAIIDWKSFNIGKDQIVDFLQANSNSSVLNRVTGNQVSQILGTLKSNGTVFLINPNGIVFGEKSSVDVGALIASTLDISNNDFINGKLNFEQKQKYAIAQILNQGVLTVENGNLALIGGTITNKGVLTSVNGNVYLLAGQKISISDLNNPKITYVLSAGTKSVNLSKIFAKGKINLLGTYVENSGNITASENSNGTVELFGTGESSTVYNSGNITAHNISVQGKYIALDGHAQLRANANATSGGHVFIGSRNGTNNTSSLDGQAVNTQSLSIAQGVKIYAAGGNNSQSPYKLDNLNGFSYGQANTATVNLAASLAFLNGKVVAENAGLISFTGESAIFGSSFKIDTDQGLFLVNLNDITVTNKLNFDNGKNPFNVTYNPDKNGGSFGATNPNVLNTNGISYLSNQTLSNILYDSSVTLKTHSGDIAIENSQVTDYGTGSNLALLSQGKLSFNNVTVNVKNLVGESGDSFNATDVKFNVGNLTAFAGQNNTTLNNVTFNNNVSLDFQDSALFDTGINNQINSLAGASLDKKPVAKDTYQNVPLYLNLTNVQFNLGNKDSATIQTGYLTNLAGLVSVNGATGSSFNANLLNVQQTGSLQFNNTVANLNITGANQVAYTINAAKDASIAAYNNAVVNFNITNDGSVNTLIDASKTKNLSIGGDARSQVNFNEVAYSGRGNADNTFNFFKGAASNVLNSNVSFRVNSTSAGKTNVLDFGTTKVNQNLNIVDQSVVSKTPGQLLLKANIDAQARTQTVNITSNNNVEIQGSLTGNNYNSVSYNVKANTIALNNYSTGSQVNTNYSFTNLNGNDLNLSVTGTANGQTPSLTGNVTVGTDNVLGQGPQTTHLNVSFSNTSVSANVKTASYSETNFSASNTTFNQGQVTVDKVLSNPHNIQNLDDAVLQNKVQLNLDNVTLNNASFSAKAGSFTLDTPASKTNNKPNLLLQKASSFTLSTNPEQPANTNSVQLLGSITVNNFNVAGDPNADTHNTSAFRLLSNQITFTGKNNLTAGTVQAVADTINQTQGSTLNLNSGSQALDQNTKFNAQGVTGSNNNLVKGSFLVANKLNLNGAVSFKGQLNLVSTNNISLKNVSVAGDTLGFAKIGQISNALAYTSQTNYLKGTVTLDHVNLAVNSLGLTGLNLNTLNQSALSTNILSSTGDLSFDHSTVTLKGKTKYQLNGNLTVSNGTTLQASDLEGINTLCVTGIASVQAQTLNASTAYIAGGIVQSQNLIADNIQVAGNAKSVINSQNNITAKSFNVQGTASVTGNNITVDNKAQFNGYVTLTANKLTVGALNLTATTATVKGNLTQTNQNQGGLTLSDSSLSVAGTTKLAGSAVLTGSKANGASLSTNSLQAISLQATNAKLVVSQDLTTGNTNLQNTNLTVDGNLTVANYQQVGGTTVAGVNTSATGYQFNLSDHAVFNGAKSDLNAKGVDLNVSSSEITVKDAHVRDFYLQNSNLTTNDLTAETTGEVYGKSNVKASGDVSVASVLTLDSNGQASSFTAHNLSASSANLNGTAVKANDIKVATNFNLANGSLTANNLTSSNQVSLTNVTATVNQVQTNNLDVNQTELTVKNLASGNNLYTTNNSKLNTGNLVFSSVTLHDTQLQTDSLSNLNSLNQFNSNLTADTVSFTGGSNSQRTLTLQNSNLTVSKSISSSQAIETSLTCSTLQAGGGNFKANDFSLDNSKANFGSLDVANSFKVGDNSRLDLSNDLTLEGSNSFGKGSTITVGDNFSASQDVSLTSSSISTHQAKLANLDLENEASFSALNTQAKNVTINQAKDSKLGQASVGALSISSSNVTTGKLQATSLNLQAGNLTSTDLTVSKDASLNTNANLVANSLNAQSLSLQQGSSATVAQATQLQGDLTVNLGSNAKLGDLTAKSALVTGSSNLATKELNLQGYLNVQQSALTATGTTNVQDLTVSSTSQVKLADLNAHNATVDSSSFTAGDVYSATNFSASGSSTNVKVADLNASNTVTLNDATVSTNRLEATNLVDNAKLSAQQLKVQNLQLGQERSLSTNSLEVTNAKLSNKSMLNTKTLDVSNDLTLATGAQVNTGTATVGNATTVQSAASLNAGTLTTGSLLLQGASLTSQTVKAQSASILDSATVTNTGNFDVTNALIVKGSVFNAGKVQAGSANFDTVTAKLTSAVFGSLGISSTNLVASGNVNVQSGQLLLARNTSISAGSLTAQSLNLQGQSSITTTGAVNLSQGATLTESTSLNAGSVKAGGSLQLDNAKLTTTDLTAGDTTIVNQSSLSASGNVVTGSTVVNNSSFTAANSLTASSLNTDNASVTTGALSLGANGDLLASNSKLSTGSLHADDLSLTNSSLVANGDTTLTGELHAKQGSNIETNNLQAQTLSLTTSNLKGQDLTVSGKVFLDTDTNTHVNSLTTAGSLTSQGVFTAANSVKSGSAVISNNFKAGDFTTGSLLLQDATFRAQSLTASSATLNNVSRFNVVNGFNVANALNLTRAYGKVGSLTAGNTNSYNSVLTVDGDAKFNSLSLNLGEFDVKGDLSVATGTLLLDNSSRIFTGGLTAQNLRLQDQSFITASNDVNLSGDAILTQGTSIAASTLKSKSLLLDGSKVFASDVTSGNVIVANNGQLNATGNVKTDDLVVKNAQLLAANSLTASKLNINSAAVTTGALTVEGDINTADSTVSTGSVNANNLNVSNTALTINGDTSLTGNLQVNNNSNLVANNISSQAVTVSNSVFKAGNLEANGAVNFNPNTGKSVQVNSLTATGDLSSQGTFVSTNSVSVGNATISGSFKAGQLKTGNLQLATGTTLSAQGTVVSSLTIGDQAQVTLGNLKVDHELLVGANSRLKTDNANVAGLTKLKAGATFDGNALTTSYLYANKGKLSLSSLTSGDTDLENGSSLTVTGNTQVANLTVNSSTASVGNLEAQAVTVVKGSLSSQLTTASSVYGNNATLGFDNLGVNGNVNLVNNSSANGNQLTATALSLTNSQAKVSTVQANLTAKNSSLTSDLVAGNRVDLTNSNLTTGSLSTANTYATDSNLTVSKELDAQILNLQGSNASVGSLNSQNIYLYDSSNLTASSTATTTVKVADGSSLTSDSLNAQTVKAIDNSTVNTTSLSVANYVDLESGSQLNTQDLKAGSLLLTNAYATVYNKGEAQTVSLANKSVLSANKFNADDVTVGSSTVVANSLEVANGLSLVGSGLKVKDLLKANTLTLTNSEVKSGADNNIFGTVTAKNSGLVLIGNTSANSLSLNHSTLYGTEGSLNVSETTSLTNRSALEVGSVTLNNLTSEGNSALHALNLNLEGNTKIDKTDVRARELTVQAGENNFVAKDSMVTVLDKASISAKNITFDNTVASSQSMDLTADKAVTLTGTNTRIVTQSFTSKSADFNFNNTNQVAASQIAITCNKANGLSCASTEKPATSLFDLEANNPTIQTANKVVNSQLSNAIIGKGGTGTGLVTGDSTDATNSPTAKANAITGQDDDGASKIFSKTAQKESAEVKAEKASTTQSEATATTKDDKNGKDAKDEKDGKNTKDKNGRNDGGSNSNGVVNAVNVSPVRREIDNIADNLGLSQAVEKAAKVVDKVVTNNINSVTKGLGDVSKQINQATEAVKKAIEQLQQAGVSQNALPYGQSDEAFKQVSTTNIADVFATLNKQEAQVAAATKAAATEANIVPPPVVKSAVVRGIGQVQQVVDSGINQSVNEQIAASNVPGFFNAKTSTKEYSYNFKYGDVTLTCDRGTMQGVNAACVAQPKVDNPDIQQPVSGLTGLKLSH